jgi:hypothetical protein
MRLPHGRLISISPEDAGAADRCLEPSAGVGRLGWPATLTRSSGTANSVHLWRNTLSWVDPTCPCPAFSCVPHDTARGAYRTE